MIWRHLSELAIDKLLAGEVTPGEDAAMRDHAKDCTPCNERLTDALAVQRQFAQTRPLLPIVVPRPRRRPAIYAATTALAAALVLVVVWPRHAANHDAAAAVRTKGDAIAGFYVAHGDAVRRGGLRETVASGDRIELFTSTTTRAWFAATSIDGAGQRTVYISPRAIEPGHEQVLPLSIELDDTLGEETVTTAFCPEPFDAEHVPASCTVDHFTLVKVPQ